MKNLLYLPKLLLLLPLFSLFLVQVDAQTQRTTNADDDLVRTIASLDTAVFDAYNRCDLEKLGSFFAEDLEFYHDQSGLTRSRQSRSRASGTISAAR